MLNKMLTRIVATTLVLGIAVAPVFASSTAPSSNWRHHHHHHHGGIHIRL